MSVYTERPISPDATECPDCHAGLTVSYSEPRCPFKVGPGYGACGDVRPPATLAEAAAALAASAYPDRDYNYIHVPLRDPRGRPLRAWPDFRDAVRRARGSER